MLEGTSYKCFTLWTICVVPATYVAVAFIAPVKLDVAVNNIEPDAFVELNPAVYDISKRSPATTSE